MNALPQNITKIHRIEPIGTKTGFPQTQTVFEITDGIWDLSSVKLLFTFNSDGVAPRGIDCLISSLSVSFDDVEVQSINNYHHLTRLMAVHNTPATSSNMLGNAQAVDLISMSDDEPYVIDRFHGILGTKDCVIKGRVRICIVWADAAVLLRDNDSTSYEISDLHLIVRSEIQDNVTERVEFDNFSSMFQLNENENQQTNIYIASRDIEYAIATFMTEDFHSKTSTQDYNGTSYYFSQGIPSIITNDAPVYVGISVNNIPVADHPINYFRANEYLDMIFDNDNRSMEHMTTLTKDGTLLIRSASTLATRQWALGLPIDVMDEDISYNITFHSTGNINTKNYSLLFVKYNSLLEIDTGENGSKYFFTR
jgi:hypothetical protein